MHDEKTHDAGQNTPDQRPRALERYARERKALQEALARDNSDDPLLDAQLKYDLLPLGHDL